MPHDGRPALDIRVAGPPRRPLLAMDAPPDWNSSAARQAACQLYDQYLWECTRTGTCNMTVLEELRRRCSEMPVPGFDEYDPHEARNPHGEWTKGGAGAAKTGQPASGRGAERGGGSAGRTAGASEAQSSAEKAASGYPKLEGLPDQPLKLGGSYYVPGPLGAACKAAEDYMKSAGLPYDPPKQYLKVDPALGTRIAQAFDQMKHDPDNPQVKAAYAALAKETMAQWQFVKGTGLKVDWLQPGKEDPYVEGLDLIPRDARENNHLTEFPTDLGYGTADPTARNDNPMLQDTGEVVAGHRCVVNDIFRIVHDYFGHFATGAGFSDDGEENAWRHHASMFSPLARGALTSETRGQASWVNHGPYGEHNRTADAHDIHYAPQKIGLMPAWTWEEGAKDKPQAHDKYDPHEPRDPKGEWTKGGGSKAGSPSGGETGGKTNGAGTHPGHGYSAQAKLINGVIHTTDVGDAVRALYENRKVSLSQPRQLSTLVAKLGDVARRMERLGAKAPNFDLCNVAVENTNLFCAQNMGIPRIQMPQLGKGQEDAFHQYLQGKGIKATEEEESAAYLRATQDELIGVKVSEMMKGMRGRDPSQDQPLFVSRDNYILDGHHRWAARVGLDAEDNRLGQSKVKIVRVDLPITDLLAEADTFTGGKGKRGTGAGDEFKEGEHPRDQGGKFSISGENGHYEVRTPEGQYVGAAHLAQGHPFISAVQLEPAFQRQGVGHQLYEHIEKDLGRSLVPSPLGLTEKSTGFWKKRLAQMPPEQAAALVDEAKKIGLSYGIKEAHIDERLAPLRRPPAQDDYDPNEKRDEGGKWTEGGSGRATEKPDECPDASTCAIHSVAHLTGEPLKKVWELARPYWSKRSGMKPVDTARVLKSLGYEEGRYRHDLTFHPYDVDKSGRKNGGSLNMGELKERLDKEPKDKKFLITTSGHSIAYANGELLDVADVGPRTLVRMVYEIEKKDGQAQDEYDPNEPRDPKGEWTTGGGAGRKPSKGHHAVALRDPASGKVYPSESGGSVHALLAEELAGKVGNKVWEFETGWVDHTGKFLSRKEMKGQPNFAPEDDFEALIAKSKAEVEEREKETAKIVAAGKAVKMSSSRRAEHKALVGPDMSEPGKFRITRFDDQGPFGHTVYNSFKEAVEDALREGFEPESEAAPASPKSKEPDKISVNVQHEDGHIEKVDLPDEIVEQARHMPEAPEKYFKTETEGAELLPVSKLIQQRARPKGIANAVKFMEAAYRGEFDRRGPIYVQKLDSGQYKVLDGNSTTTIASAAGWKVIPAITLPDESYLPKKKPKDAAKVEERKKITGDVSIRHVGPRRLGQDKFDPSEPRDETGEWTTGGGTAKKPSASQAGQSPPIDEPKPSAEAAKLTSDLSRHRSSMFSTADPDAKQKAREAVTDDIQKLCAVVAKTMGMSPDDPDKIAVNFETPPTFNLADRQAKYSGGCNLKTGVITIYTQATSTKEITNVLAHELMHRKFGAVWERYLSDKDQIANDEKKRVLENNRRHKKGEPEETTRILNWNTGQVNEKYAGNYPFYEKLNTLTNTTDLAKDDGITDYSREWWKAFNDGKAESLSTVHETLAEMAKLDWEGSLPRLLWFKDSTTWKPLYEAINELYDTHIKSGSKGNEGPSPSTGIMGASMPVRPSIPKLTASEERLFRRLKTVKQVRDSLAYNKTRQRVDASAARKVKELTRLLEKLAPE